MEASLEGLPDELVLKVLSCLDLPSVLVCRRVSRRLRALAGDRCLFADVDLSHQAWQDLFDATEVDARDRRLMAMVKSLAGILASGSARLISLRAPQGEIGASNAIADALEVLLEAADTSALHSLDLRECETIGSESLVTMLMYVAVESEDQGRAVVSSLERLNVSGCFSVDDRLLCLLPAIAPRLVDLDLWATAVGSSGMRALARFDHLERLRLGYCEVCNPDAVAAGVAGCGATLRYLDLTKTCDGGLEADHLSMILRSCASLEWISLQSQYALCDDHIPAMVPASVRYLSFSICSVSPSAVEALVASRRPPVDPLPDAVHSTAIHIFAMGQKDMAGVDGVCTDLFHRECVFVDEGA